MYCSAKRIFFIAAICCYQASRLFAQDIVAQIESLQHGRFSKTIVKTKNGSDVQYAVTFTNDAGSAQNLSSVNITLGADILIPDSTPFVIGADEMLRKEGNMLQYKTGQSIRNKDNNMYLMFKTGASNYLLIGVTSWRTFLCRIYPENGMVRIEGDGDNKLIKAGEKLAFEKIVFLKDSSWQNLLSRYADAIVKENKVAPPPNVQWQGWATWDYYKQYFTPEAVERNTNDLLALHANANIIQIDGGWWNQRGDYFEVRENLPGGIKAMVEKIHKAGFKAGLHFDGFRASKGSRIVKEHPEYFVHNTDGDLLELGKDKVTNDPLVVWDYSHPGACAYITSVMKNARENWKVDYFKIDFMRQGLTKGVNYLPVTNVERYRKGVKAISAGIGAKYFLACGPNFGVNIGLVPATRTGPDIDPEYEAVKLRVAHNAASYYFSQKIYNCDPDYLVLRSAKESDAEDRKKASLTLEQAKMWANFVTIFGTTRLESDELHLLTAEKKELVKQVFRMPFFTTCVPIDLWDHFKTDNDAPNIFLAKTAEGTICLGIFNWGNDVKQFNLAGFKTTASFTDMPSKQLFTTKEKMLSITLQGEHSLLLQYAGQESFDQLRTALKLEPFTNK